MREIDESIADEQLQGYVSVYTFQEDLFGSH